MVINCIYGLFTSFKVIESDIVPSIDIYTYMIYIYICEYQSYRRHYKQDTEKRKKNHYVISSLKSSYYTISTA